MPPLGFVGIVQALALLRFAPPFFALVLGQPRFGVNGGHGGNGVRGGIVGAITGSAGSCVCVCVRGVCALQQSLDGSERMRQLYRLLRKNGVGVYDNIRVIHAGNKSYVPAWPY